MATCTNDLFLSRIKKDFYYLFYLIFSDPIKSKKEARDAFIFNRLLPGVYFAFLTACGLLGGFGFALGRTKKRETTAKLTQQQNATRIFDDGQRLRFIV
jgi:hypothetical protein